MADLESRVATLERELTTLKARVDTIDEDVTGIPDLIKTESRLTNSRIARLAADLEKLSDLPAKVDALPRVVAELVVEMLGQRGGRM